MENDYSKEDVDLLIQMLECEGWKFLAKRIQDGGLGVLGRKDIRKLLFDTPFSSLPLVLKDNYGTQTFVLWRLQIGK